MLKIFQTALMLLFVVTGWAQNQFAFYKDAHELFQGSLTVKPTVLGTDIKIKRSYLYTASNYLTYSTMPREILNALPIADGMEFHSALQFPGEKTWLFLERNLETNAYNVCFYDAEKKAKRTLFSQNDTPDNKYAFRPIAWVKTAGVIYLEAMVFGSASENEGVWSYTIATQQFAKLSITAAYITTPVISPDGQYFIYGATSGVKGVESELNGLYVYDIAYKTETLIAKDERAFYSIAGWTQGNIQQTDILRIDDPDTSFSGDYAESAIQQIAFKLPWENTTSHCVSRTGSLLPNLHFPAACGPSNCSGHSGDHGYQAIDFVFSLYTPVLAVAGGTVVFAWFNASGTTQLTGGYGNLVKIRLSDNTYTYYAHLSEIAVKVGDVVTQGCIIGKSGNTGHSSGPHLHFEWRDVSDAKFNNDTHWPVFAEYGCTPNINRSYVSQNIKKTCSNSDPLNCASAVTLTCGQSYNGKTEGKSSSLSNVTTGDFSNVSTNPYNSWSDPGPEDIYKIVTTTTGTITATLSNYATGLDLDVFILPACSLSNPEADNVTVSSTACTMTNAPAGTYYILVDGSGYMYPAGQSTTSYNGHYGSYTINVSCIPTCQIPTDLSTTNITTNTATLIWPAVSGAANYSVQWRLPGGTWTDLSGTWTSTTLTISGFASGTAYEWRVRSNCGDGQVSAWSSGLSFTTIAITTTNDNCSSATTLTVGSTCSSIISNNTSATPTTPAPAGSCPAAGYKDVWFKFTMPNVSLPQVTIRTTAGSLVDAVMEVYAGTNCSNLTYITCEDDNSTGNNSYMPVINLQGGPRNTIWVRVWGYSGSSGTFGICVFNYYSVDFAEENSPLITIPASTEPMELRESASASVLSLQVREDLSARLHVTPNPANDALQVSFSPMENCQALSIMLSDLSGKSVLQKACTSGSDNDMVERVDVTGLLPGIYVLQVMTTSGLISKRIMVAHE